MTSFNTNVKPATQPAVPETTPCIEQGTKPRQKPAGSSLDVGHSVPVMEFEGNNGFYAMLRVESHGRIRLTVYGNCEPFHIDGEALPGLELQDKFSDFPIALNL